MKLRTSVVHLVGAKPWDLVYVELRADCHNAEKVKHGSLFLLLGVRKRHPGVSHPLMTDEKAREPISIAYYCTGHGYGHATRSIEVSTQSHISLPL